MGAPSGFADHEGDDDLGTVSHGRTGTNVYVAGKGETKLVGDLVLDLTVSFCCEIAREDRGGSSRWYSLRILSGWATATSVARVWIRRGAGGGEIEREFFRVGGETGGMGGDADHEIGGCIDDIAHGCSDDDAVIERQALPGSAKIGWAMTSWSRSPPSERCQL